MVRSWLFLGALAGIGTVTKHLVVNRKRLRARSMKLLVWLKGVCKVVGKLGILKRKLRERYALRVRKM